MTTSKSSGYIILLALLLGIFIIGLMMTLRGSDGVTKTERDFQAIKEAEAVKEILEQRDREQSEY